MGKLRHSFFRSELYVCEFANRNNVEIKHIAVKVMPAIYDGDKTEVTYVAFYEDKEDGKIS